MDLKPLVLDHNGNLSHTKVWSNIAYVVATYIVIKLTINNTLTEDYFLWYLTIVAGHTAISKYLTSIKSNSQDLNPNRTPDIKD